MKNKKHKPDGGGPLDGIRVIEMEGLAPVPFCGMILADFGAQVLRIDRPSVKNKKEIQLLSRGKTTLEMDLKNPIVLNKFLKLVQKADILIEPYRPGVMEKLGLGPEVLFKKNSKLIYARLTGFGQSGKQAQLAGHDINFLARSGVLSLMGRKNAKPTPPINLLGDFAAGGLLCALGILLALFERSRRGSGQIVDTPMTEGVSYLSSFIYESWRRGQWKAEPGCNLIDTGAPFYDTYQTQDAQWMAVGAIERKFFVELLKGLGIPESQYPNHLDENCWPRMCEDFEKRFSLKTRKEWEMIFKNKDACVTPVLLISEAKNHLGFHRGMPLLRPYLK